MAEINAEGRKDDAGKARFDLIPPYPLYQVAELFAMGAKKYADRNWEQGLKWGRVFAAMMRHAWKWWAGEANDPEDGQHHLTSVIWCAMVLLEYTRTHRELDDRSSTQTTLNSLVIRGGPMGGTGRVELVSHMPDLPGGTGGGRSGYGGLSAEQDGGGAFGGYPR